MNKEVRNEKEGQEGQKGEEEDNSGEETVVSEDRKEIVRLQQNGNENKSLIRRILFQPS